MPTALFSDDFSGYTGWAVEDHGDYAYGFAQGGYFIRVEIPNATIWSAKSIDASDIRIDTQVAQLEGPDTGYFGVMCRQQQDGFNYYALVINNVGFFGIGKVVNGALQFIQTGTDQSGIINRGELSNRISSVCKGNELTLIVNDQELLTVQDDLFSGGTIGLVAGLQKGTGLYVLYSNFIANEP